MPLQWLNLGGSVEEARKPKTGPQEAPANVQRAGYEYGIPQSGLTEYSQGIGDATQSDRRALMVQLYESTMACTWASACIDAISRTITGGGLVFDWDADDGEGDQEEPEKPAEVLACERLFKFTNSREDSAQLLRGTISDLLTFGDAYIEVCWLGKLPVAMYSLDCPSMNPIADEHGNISGYVQVTDLGQRATFKPHEVIHISMDSPRSGIFGVSPTQKALLPITEWLFASATLKEIYRKGAPPNIHVDLPQGTSPTDTNRWLAQYASRNIGPRNLGNPIITRGGAAITELQAARVAEIQSTKNQARDEIISTYGVPPAEVAIIESGNLGGGTGESQRKSFLVNTCGPIAKLILEKLEFHLVKQGFNITGWHLKFSEVDMRDSATVEAIRDQRLRNGAWTLNRYKAEIGEPPVEGGDVAVLVERMGVILWRDMEASSTATIAKNLRGTALEPDEPTKPGDDTPVGISKPEPEPVPAMTGQPGQPGTPSGPPGDQPPAQGQPPPKGGKKPTETVPDRPVRGGPDRDVWAAYKTRLAELRRHLPPE